MKLEEILKKCANVRVIVASKYANVDEILKLFNFGFKEFGENQVQALSAKKAEIEEKFNINFSNFAEFSKENDKNLNPTRDLKWHFIGTLQTNKINLLLRQRPILWHSCNSYELALKVDKRLDYELETLLEINSANEHSKSGISPDRAVDEFLKIKENCKNLKLKGVMSIGAMNNEKMIKSSFERTFKIFENLKKHGAEICSMGMSSDFELALKCGSNMLRLGSIIFESLRKYKF